MAADQQFCLRWNNHQSTLISVFDTLLASEQLVDCTLAAEGQYLKAHKVVLSACSPYLELLLSQHYEKHPIVILKDVKFQELKSMMDYMYRGEVNISQDQLATFLKAAESLQIKGLTDSGEDSRDVGSTKRVDGAAQGARKPVAAAAAAAAGSSGSQRASPAVQGSGLTIEPRQQPPATSPHRSRDGSMSPTPRKRRRARRPSQGDAPDSHNDTSNSCDLPPSAAPLALPAPEHVETDQLLNNSRLQNSETVLIKEKVEPTSELMIEPKTEYMDENNEDSVEDLTLDDDDDLDMNRSGMDMGRPGPSHGDSNQGFASWHMQGDRSGTDEVFMAAQEAVGAHRDSQGCGLIVSDVFSLHGVNGDLESKSPKKTTAFDADTALEQLRLNGVSSDPIPENGEECLDEYYPEYDFFPTKYRSLRNNHQSTRNYYHSARDHHQSTRNYYQPTSTYHQSTRNYHQPTRNYHQSTRNYHQSTRNHHHSTRNYHHQLTHTDTDNVETALEQLRQNGVLTIPISESGEVLQDEYYPEYDYFSTRYHSTRNYNHQLSISIADDGKDYLQNAAKPSNYQKFHKTNYIEEELTIETNRQDNFVEVEVIADDNTSRTQFRCNKCLQRFQSRRILGQHMMKCGKEEVNEELDKEIEIVEKKVKKKVPVVEKLNNLKQKNESFVNELKTVAVNDNVPSRIYHCKKCKTDYNLRKSYMRHIGLTCERRRSKAKLLLQSVEKMEAKTNLKPQIKNETTDSIKPHINKTNGSLFKKQPVPKKSGSNYRTCKICRKQFSTKYTLARHIRTLECSLKRKQLAGGSMPRRQKLKTH